MARYQKLVRDGVPDLLDAKGVPYEKHIAQPKEYTEELVRKLVEEAREFEEARTVEELADVIEVLEALRQLPQYAESEEVRLAKRAERGGFEKRIILKGEN